MTSRIVVTLGSIGLLATLAGIAVAEGPPDGSTPEQRAVIAGDPPFKPRVLTLGILPSSAQAPTSLFDGKSLAGWDSWLGAEDYATTYSPHPGTPIGLNHDTHGVFTVVREDGAPAILSSGKIFGGLLTKGSYSNYHLHVEYKWGAHAWVPGMPRNNGVLYHSTGPYGAFFGAWMQAIEFEVVPHSVGMLLAVGESRTPGTFRDVAWNVGADVAVGHDPKIAYPMRRYMPGGRVISVVPPGYNVEGATDAERPVGAWNSLDLYVLGDRSIHVVNGVPVMAADHLSMRGADGQRHPLTKGRIQLQSEGAETFFRNITIQPIAALPTIVEGKAG